MMKLSLLALLLASSSSSAAAAAAFAPGHRQQQRAFVAVAPATSSAAVATSPPFGTALRMSDGEEKEGGGALVPIKEETVEFTAGILGATAGFLAGGPVLAFIVGAAANYVSKMDGDVAEVVQAVSKSSIQIFNYLTRLDQKYEILDKTKDKLEEAVDGLKAKGTVDPEALSKVETALETTKSKIEEINDEYDLVGAGMTALGVVGDLVEKAVKKAGELNEEYQLSGKALDALKTSVDKAKDAAKEAQTKL
jgi:hypothetical protein